MCGTSIFHLPSFLSINPLRSNSEDRLSESITNTKKRQGPRKINKKGGKEDSHVSTFSNDTDEPTEEFT